MLRNEKKEIDGHKVEVTAFMALRGLELKGRLLKLLGPAFSGMVKGIRKGKTILDIDVNMNEVGNALLGLTENLSQPGVIDLIIDLLQYVQYDGKVLKKETIDMEFAANYMTLYKVLLFVVDANRFFGNRSIGEAIKNQNIIQKMTNTPNTSQEESIQS